MPPHCDSMDGPVVRAAIKALNAENVDLVLPFIPKEGEQEVINAFEKVIQIRKKGSDVQEIADRYFFETVVCIHRAGERAAFTGLKPAGLDVGPVILLAEKTIESGTPDELIANLCETVTTEVKIKLERIKELEREKDKGVESAREYVGAMLGLEVWSHKLHQCILVPPHHGAHAD